MKRTVQTFIGLFLVLALSDLTAHEGLTRDQIKALEMKGQYDEALSRAKAHRSHLFDDGLTQNGSYKLTKAALAAAGLSSDQIREQLYGGRLADFPFAAEPELKSKGTVHTLTVLIDFSDHRAEDELPDLEKEIFRQNIYGDGTPLARKHAPYESVHAYYNRASQARLDLQGDVLGWHHLDKKQNTYAPDVKDKPESKRRELENHAIFEMARSVLAANDETIDYSKYDNDKDGDIDSLTVLYAGPHGKWNSFWWAYRWFFFVQGDTGVTFDGKRLKQFVFSFIETRDKAKDFNPITLIHETGHSFGLADYYDYDKDSGPPGGVGGIDMMHSNMGNHNAFSRWLLDWIEPEIMKNVPPVTTSLVASGSAAVSNEKAVVVFPGAVNPRAPDQELFIIENRTRLGNDDGESGMPGDGLLVWHVDATTNESGTNFANDNSYTKRKLIRLVRARNAADFASSERATASDYFVKGREFSPASNPVRSVGYDGLPTNVAVTDITEAGETISANIGFYKSIPKGAGPTAMQGDSRKMNPDSDQLKMADECKDINSCINRANTEVGAGALRLETLEALKATLSSQSAEDIKKALANVAVPGGSGDPSPQKDALITLLVAQFGRKADAGSVLALVKGETVSLTSKQKSAVLEAWAENDPERVADWFFREDGQTFLEDSRIEQLGEGFTRAVYRWTALNNAADAVSKVEALKSYSAISGAISGINAAVASNNENKKSIQDQIAKLPINGQKAADVMKFDAVLRGLLENTKSKEEKREISDYMKQRIFLEK